ncbi:serine/threonine-protein kinase [Ideonella sp. DXS29W]|uniref:Serine/threonine-protein kinase n=1 Tax=Ideonella lacteola TaxID=2984193 RepID=A0ABU9BHZ4_9BURK
MVSLTAPQMAQVSRLWDEACALDGAARRCWLEQQRHLDPPVRESLQRLCEAPEACADDSFLGVPVLDLMPDVQPLTTLQAGDVVGPYRLDVELGRGGMGVVWSATRIDGAVTRRVALKLPHPWLASTNALHRFARERDILASFNHPHIAHLYDAGVSAQGQPYFALELVDGLPITTYCTAHALSLEQRIELFLQVLDAVHYAHEHQVVHRDLKPANILVSSDGMAHLLDFGIAKLLDDPDAVALTQLGVAGWTPAYASPEQIGGSPVTAQSDVYALGVLFYELICGQRPYSVNRSTRAAIEDAILNADVLPPSAVVSVAPGIERPRQALRQLRRRLRGDLDVVALTALQRPLAQRFATAKAFADDLRRFLAGEPVVSRADSRIRRVRRFLYRYRVFAGSAAAVVIGLGAGLVLAWNAAVKAREHERTAEAALSFMQDLFNAEEIDLESAHRPGERTVRELLDLGSRRIDASLKDAPRVKARIYGSLARMYEQLVLNTEVREVSRKWVVLARERAHEDPHDLVEALIAFGRSWSVPTDAESMAAFREAETILDKLGTSTPEDRWRRGRLETAHARLLIVSDRAQARRRLQHATELLADTPDKSELGQALLVQAEDFNRAHQPDAALRLVEQTLALGPVDNITRLNAMQIRCIARAQQGDLRGALDDGTMVRDAVVATYGADTEWPAYLTSTLGGLYLRASQPAEAVKLMSNEVDVLTISRRPDTVKPLVLLFTHLVAAEISRGRLADAQLWLSRMQTLEQERGAEVGDTIRVHSLAAHAALLVEQGRHEAAKAKIDEGLALAARVGSDRVLIARKLRYLAVHSLIDQGQLSQARAAFDEANNQFDEPAGVTAPPLGQEALERSLLEMELSYAQGRLDAARVAGDLLLSNINTNPHPALFQSAQRRAEVLMGLVDVKRERPEEALVHFDRAVTLDTGGVDRDSLDNIPLWVGRGFALLQLNRWAEANESARKARAIIDHHGEVAEHHQRTLSILTLALETAASSLGPVRPL